MGLACAIISPSPASATDSPRLAAMKKTLAGVPALELPAKAAKLVWVAKAKDREATARLVVDAAVSVRSAATPSVVGAIVKRTPAVTGVVVAEALLLQPGQASLIRAAAASYAPVETEVAIAAFEKTNVLQGAAVVAGLDPSSDRKPKQRRYANPSDP
jgi:hypothetical protein